jgi:hypothetical protein
LGLSGCVEDSEFHDQLIDYQLLKERSVLWSLLAGQL